MKLFDLVRIAESVNQINERGIATPFAASTLSKIVVSDLVGMKVDAVTREEAMQVPAIVKARSLIAGLGASLPLRQYEGDQQADTEPAWLSRSGTEFSPQARMLWTLDDILFYGGALWALDRDPGTGEVIDAIRVPKNMWIVDENGDILIDGEPIDSDQVCLIEGPQEGLLKLAERTIKGATAIDEAWTQRVQSPVPMVELHSTDSTRNLLEDEAAELVRDWETARSKGGTSYTPAEIELRVHGSTQTDLFVEGRNAVRLDVANYTQVPGSLLEGSMSVASLTYSTTEGRRNEFLDYCLSYWLNCVAARLSMDDMTPPGTRIGFDYSYLLEHPADQTRLATKD